MENLPAEIGGWADYIITTLLAIFGGALVWINEKFEKVSGGGSRKSRVLFAAAVAVAVIFTAYLIFN
jgi:hypothetical protein